MIAPGSLFHIRTVLGNMANVYTSLNCSFGYGKARRLAVCSTEKLTQEATLRLFEGKYTMHTNLVNKLLSSYM